MRAVNLIPQDQRRGAGGIAGRSGGIVYVVVGGLSVVVALGVVYAFAVHSVAQRKGQLAQVTQEVGSVQLQAAALEPYVQVYSLRQTSVQATVQLAESRFNWPDAMRQLALALPSDVSLTSVTANAGGVTAATAGTTTTTTGGPTFALQGCASSQSETALVLNRLEHTPEVTDVQLQTTVKEPSGSVSSGPPKWGDAAPNAAPPGPRNIALAVSGRCPLVSFTLTVTYNSTYTVPNQKLPNSDAQTVANHSTVAQTTSAQPSSVTR